MSRRGSLTAAGALVAVVVAVVAVVTLTGGGREQGPLVARDVIAVSFFGKAGTKLSYGVPVVINQSDKVAVLERVRLQRPDKGLEFIGAMAAGKERRAILLSADEAFPPRRQPIAGLRDVRGFRVAPEPEASPVPGVELVIGLRAAKPGRYVVHGFWVDYRIGDERYSRRPPNAGALCAYAVRQPAKPRCRRPPVPDEDGS